MIYSTDYGARWHLPSPTQEPKAAGFLWNRHIEVQASCRGLWASRFKAPDMAMYNRRLNTQRVMSDVQAGRFVYIRDEHSGELYSAPYEPVRRSPEMFNFSVGQHDITWDACFDGIDIRIQLTLAADEPLELWSITVANRSPGQRQLSVYPYFSLNQAASGFQCAEYRPDVEGIVAKTMSGAPNHNAVKQSHFVLHERTPSAWQVQAEAFVGEGGLHNPDALQQDELVCDDGRQEASVAVLQYRPTLAPGASETYRFIAGNADSKRDIYALRERYLSAAGFARAQAEYKNYLAGAEGIAQIDTPDETLNHFVNHWLPRQMFYCADTQRLSEQLATDDYLHDLLGLIYLNSERARTGFLTALSQQQNSGAMPEAISSETETLVRISRNAHTSHCVWLPIFLRIYLDETGDTSILREPLSDRDGKIQSVFERVNRAMHWLIQARDIRGLSDMTPGDSGNSALGRRGAGSSSCQSLMAAYALNLWADICDGELLDSLAEKCRSAAAELNQAVNTHLWDGDWYARGITDSGITFGTRRDDEGQIFLAPQVWALLAGTCNDAQQSAMLAAIEQHLLTPHGVMNMAPSYTHLRRDIGNLSHDHPGLGENGAIDSNVAARYAQCLYRAGEPERAYAILRSIIPGPDGDDYRQRGQLPTFMPSASFGAYNEYPARTGSSTQVYSTAAATTVYRALLEGLLGLVVEQDGLCLQPQLPDHWPTAKVVRKFRGATLYISIERESGVTGTHISVDGNVLDDDGVIRNLQPGKRYQVEIVLGQAPLALMEEDQLEQQIRKTA